MQDRHSIQRQIGRELDAGDVAEIQRRIELKNFMKKQEKELREYQELYLKSLKDLDETLDPGINRDYESVLSNHSEEFNDELDRYVRELREKRVNSLVEEKSRFFVFRYVGRFLRDSYLKNGVFFIAWVMGVVSTIVGGSLYAYYIYDSFLETILISLMCGCVAILVVLVLGVVHQLVYDFVVTPVRRAREQLATEIKAEAEREVSESMHKRKT